MKKDVVFTRSLLVTFVCVTVAGAVLHGLFELWPSILTEFAAPVSESIWEHIKIVFWPLLVGLPTLYGGKRLSSVLAAVLVCSGGVLLFGWIVHILLGCPAGLIDVSGYVLLMAVGSILPGLWRLSEEWTSLLLGGVILLLGLIVTFTIMPLDLRLFHDASLVDAWVVHTC